MCYQADLRYHRTSRRWSRTSSRTFLESVDILVHSAGVIRLSSFEGASRSELDWHYKVNVRAPYLLTQGLLLMIKARQGQIVFVNSTAGLRAGHERQPICVN